MDHDSTENPDRSGPPPSRRGSDLDSQQPDLPPQEGAGISTLDSHTEEEDEAQLPEVLRTERAGPEVRWRRHAAIEHAVRHARPRRRLSHAQCGQRLLYVGKAKK